MSSKGGNILDREYIWKKTGVDILWEIGGSFVTAVGIYCFADAAHIAPGGVSGLAIMAGYMWEVPIGLAAFVFNIPLLFLAWRYLGKDFTLRTLRVAVFSTFMLDWVVRPWIPVYTGERFLGSVFGGLLSGAGLGMIFLRGSSTGGTDILSFLIRMKFPHVALGKLIMFTDCIVLALSILVFGNIESALFGLIALFCQGKVIDGMIYGSVQGELFIIISRKARLISRVIFQELDRGATFLKAEGAYTQETQDIILCAARKREYGVLRRIIRETDPDAFVMVSEVREILGEGFVPIADRK